MVYNKAGIPQEVHFTYRLLINLFSNFVNSSIWQYKVTISCVLLVFVFSFPSYDRLFLDNHDYIPIWKTIATQIEAPLTVHSYPEKDHAAKIAFRLLPPMLGRLAPFDNPIHRVIFIFFLQAIAGVLFYLVVVKWAYQITSDRVLSSLFTFSFAFVYLGRSFFYEFYPFFDGIAFFLMAFALYSRTPWIVFTAVFLSYWIDERALIASPLILLYHLQLTQGKRLSLAGYIAQKKSIYLPYIGSVLLYIAIRLSLGYLFSLRVPVGSDSDAGLSVIIQQLGHLPLALFLTYEGSWWLLIGLLMYCVASKNQLTGLLYTLSFLLILIISCCVWDVTRSACYGFPLLFIAFRDLAKSNHTGYLRVLTLLVLCTSIFIPTYKYHFHSFFWQVPLPVKAVYHLTQGQ